MFSVRTLYHINPDLSIDIFNVNGYSAQSQAEGASPATPRLTAPSRFWFVRGGT